MIGRLKECQIRPKSRSVSRRHCLLHWQDDTLKVFDLDSTSGTRINGEKIPPRTWSVLPPDGELRCGKICFLFRVSGVAMRPATTGAGQGGAAAGTNDQSSPPGGNPSVAAGGPADTLHDDFGTDAIDRRMDSGDSSDEIDKFDAVETGSMLRGKAWQEADVAEFLEAEDTIEREKRYESIRSLHPSEAEDSHIFDEEELAAAASTAKPTQNPTTTQPAGRSSSDPPVASKGQAGATISQAEEQSAAKKDSAANKPKPLPPKQRRKLNRQKGAGIDTDRLKLVAVIVGTIVVIGVVSYQVYRFQVGPEVQVIEGID